jgi:LAO/AO transport system kinase
LAHTTLVIEAPGLGDDIQAIKAGILEIADVLVVNKADRPGADITERALRGMLQLAHPSPHVFRNHYKDYALEAFESKNSEDQESAIWMPPILRTVAIDGQGVPELAEAIASHYQHLTTTGELRQRERSRLRSELDNLLRETLISRWRETVSQEAYDQALFDLVGRKFSPRQAVDLLLSGGDS